MAQVIRSVKLPLPQDWYKQPRDEREAADEQWIADQRTELRAKKAGDLVGEVIRFPVADGHAAYMVASEKPLKLVHLDMYDGYQVNGILIRGLRLSDVQRHVEQDRKFKAMFANRKK